jgi:hypothetical protein
MYSYPSISSLLILPVYLRLTIILFVTFLKYLTLSSLTYYLTILHQREAPRYHHAAETILNYSSLLYLILLGFLKMAE